MLHTPQLIPESPGKAPRSSAETPARRPSDRTYRRLHWTMMGLIAAILIYGLVIARFSPPPRAVGFRLVLVILLAFNVLWWSLADRRFARYLRSGRRSLALRLLAVGFSITLSTPIAYMVVTAQIPDFLNRGPTWYAAAVTLWHLSLVSLMPLVALVRLLGLGAVGLARYARQHRGQSASEPASGNPLPPQSAIRNPQSAIHVQTLSEEDGDSSGPTRRAFLRTSFATAPMALLTGMVIASRSQEGRLVVHRHRLAAPWLPSRLHGLTITHLSDLHVGRHYRPDMLREFVEKANGLDSDLVVVTGDLVDLSNDLLPPTLHALGQLSHRHGLFICIGNHDEIDSRPEFVREVRRRFPLLLNEHRVLEIGGERITIGGLDYAERDGPSSRRAGHVANAVATLSSYNSRRDGPMIAISHHPHAFDVLAAQGVPLTLAGHTHGGQLMLSRPDERPDIGVGRLLFRYIRGFYHQGDATLFVNRGVGNWFPLRINAPAEVVQIQLTA